ncbi:MAG TPA: helix-turn-helix domain-containing protein [Thiobacillus sp.]
MGGMTPSEAIRILLEQGRTEAEVAAAVGLNQSSINRIKREVSDPTYQVGKRLIEMARRKRAA